MNSLQECINEYIKDGYTRNYAISKVCQDVIINRIYNSKYSDKITIKGGVVMFHLTQNIRRATIDIDMDLINMSIATDNIVNIVLWCSAILSPCHIKYYIGECIHNHTVGHIFPGPKAFTVCAAFCKG